MYQASVFPTMELVIVDALDFVLDYGVHLKVQIVKENGPVKLQLGQEVSILVRTTILETHTMPEVVIPRSKVIGTGSGELTLVVCSEDQSWFRSKEAVGIAGEDLAQGQCVYVKDGKVYTYAIEGTGSQKLREHQGSEDRPGL